MVKGEGALECRLVFLKLAVKENFIAHLDGQRKVEGKAENAISSLTSARSLIVQEAAETGDEMSEEFSPCL